MKSLLFSVLFCILSPWILACFEKQPLQWNLGQYLEQEESCSDTLFPKPPCCGTSKDTPSTSRIIDGKMTGLEELTWAVYIRASLTSPDFENKLALKYCGGSLINSRWILSAAHCFKKPDWTLDTVEVIVGENDIRNKEFQDVTKVKFHPLSDLALLRLQSPVEYGKFINPICLPLTPLKRKCYEKKEAVVTGWGRTSTETEEMSPVKLKATVKVLTTTPYNVHAARLHGIDYRGDSGGPLSLKLPKAIGHYLLGVVSSGNEFMSKYTRIDMEWIADVILREELN